MPGRKAVPTHLKLVRGNPGKRPLNEREPEPAAGCRKPDFMTTAAGRIWDQYAPELERIGVLTSVDGHMFAMWCSLAAEAEEGVACMTAARIAQMRALASSFGLDASSRSRIHVKQPEDVDAKAASYFS